MGKRAKGRKKPVLTQILEYLITKYHPEWTSLREQELAHRLALEGGGIIGHKTILDILSGEDKDHRKHATWEKLAPIFRRDNARIDASWFQVASLDEFKKRDEGAGERIDLRLPNYSAAVNDLQDWLPGTYIAYRYAFLQDRRIAREVLHIRKDLQFTMSTRPVGAEGESITRFSGPILPLGKPPQRIFFFVGIDIDNPTYPRGRSLFVFDDKTPAFRKMCKLGMLSSASLHGGAPCVACTLLMRLAWDLPETSLDAFIKEVTTIEKDASDDIIDRDFGKEYRSAVEICLDNCPKGTTRREDERIKPDMVLRLDTHRFDETMLPIFESAYDDGQIVAPFKTNWPKRRVFQTPTSVEGEGETTQLDGHLSSSVDDRLPSVTSDESFDDAP